MNTRLQEFDILRVIATLAVVAIHISAAYILLMPAGYYLNQLVRFAVPLFMIMSGFLLYYADNNGHFLSVGMFYRKRFSKVLWPYIIWSFIYASFAALINGTWREILPFLQSLGNHLLWGTACYHLYFLVIIFQLYLLYPWLRKTLHNSSHRLLWSSFIVTLICQTALYLNMIHLLYLPPWNMFYLVAFPVWIFYFVLGMFLAQNKALMEDRLGDKAVWWGLLWALSLGILLLDSKISSATASSIRPTVMLYTVASYCFFYALARQIHRPLGSGLSWLANQSFLIYLMHPIFLTILTIAAPRIKQPELWTGVIGMCSLYLSTLLLTVFFAYLLSLTPLSTWFGGTPTRRFQKSD